MNAAEPRPILVIANPVSGGRSAARATLRMDVIGRLEAAGCRVTQWFSRGPGDALQLARKAIASEPPAFDVIVACGGDGTVQQVAQAIAEAHSRAAGFSLRDGAEPPNAATTERSRLGKDSKPDLSGQPEKPLSSEDARQCRPTPLPVMGLIPAGRCNDFARALGIPRNAAALAPLLVTAVPRRVDLGRLGERYFCTVATLGFDAAVTRFVDRMNGRLKGTPAYLYGAARMLLEYRPIPLRLRGEFGEIEGPAFLLSTANTATYGGSIPIVPSADPFDGRFHLCLIPHAVLPRRMATMARVVKGWHIRSSGVRFLETAWLEIESPMPSEIWADGELLGATPGRLEIAPQALPLLLPGADG